MGRKQGLREVGDHAEQGRPQADAPDDFGNHARLSQGQKHTPVQQAGEDNDDGHLREK